MLTRSAANTTRSGKKRGAAPGTIFNATAVKKHFHGIKFQSEIDIKVTAKSDPSGIPFRGLAPLMCPGWIAMMNSAETHDLSAVRAGSRVDPTKKCAPRMMSFCGLFECPTCGYGPTRARYWHLDPQEQAAVFQLVNHHAGSDIMREMMLAMGSDASHLSIKYHDGFNHALLKELLNRLNVLIDELQSFFHAIDVVKITELIKTHRNKFISDTEALGLVTDVAWALITGSNPVRARMSKLSYVDRVILFSGENYRDLKKFQRELRALVLKGYCASVENGDGHSLVTALGAWSDAQDSLRDSCAFTSVCNKFIHTLSYNKFDAFKDSYHLQLRAIINTV